MTDGMKRLIRNISEENPSFGIAGIIREVRKRGFSVSDHDARDYIRKIKPELQLPPEKLIKRKNPSIPDMERFHQFTAALEKSGHTLNKDDTIKLAKIQAKLLLQKDNSLLQGEFEKQSRNEIPGLCRDNARKAFKQAKAELEAKPIRIMKHEEQGRNTPQVALFNYFVLVTAKVADQGGMIHKFLVTVRSDKVASPDRELTKSEIIWAAKQMVENHDGGKYELKFRDFQYEIVGKTRQIERGWKVYGGKNQVQGTQTTRTKTKRRKKKS